MLRYEKSEVKEGDDILNELFSLKLKVSLVKTTVKTGIPDNSCSRQKNSLTKTVYSLISGNWLYDRGEFVGVVKVLEL